MFRKKSKKDRHYIRLGKIFENISTKDLDTKLVYRISFLRGIFFGMGSLIGGTILFALLLWLLSFFTEIPLIGGIAEDIRRTIEESQ